MFRRYAKSEMEENITLKPLQEICCIAISINCDRYPENFLEELNQPCLSMLVHHLSMFDLLKLENLLYRRGIDSKQVMYGLHRKIGESYPIKATTCPHLLNFFPCDSLDWGLSCKMLHQVFNVLVAEYNDFRGEFRSSLLDGVGQYMIINKFKYLMEMYSPPGGCHEQEVREKLARLPAFLENLAVMAAKKIILVTIDISVIQFLMDKRFESILNSMYESVVIISLLLKSSPLLLDFMKKMREQGQAFDCICIYVRKNNNLYYLDEILSLCSGVAEYCSTPEGYKNKEILRKMIATDKCMNLSLFDSKYPQSRTPPLVPENPKGNTTFDLVDDAVLLGTACPPSEFDSEAGITKADFKFKKRVEIECYASLLNHHLKSWLALQELNIGVPCLHPKTVKCLTYVLQRPQFRCFTLLSTSVASSELEDIFCAVASRRNSNPLEKLMFLKVKESIESFGNFLVTDQLISKSQEEIAAFVRENQSAKLAQFHGFCGARLFEFSKCSFSRRTEVVVGQFILQNQSLETLCVSRGISHIVLQFTLRSLALTNRHLKRLILEQWRVVQVTSSSALVSLLNSVSSSLESLSIKGCCRTYESRILFRDIIEAASACTHLKHLDISENKLAGECVNLVNRILTETNVSELSLRCTALSKENVFSILKSAAEILRKRQPLNILDLRANDFVKDDKKSMRNVAKEVARCILVNDNPLLV